MKLATFNIYWLGHEQKGVRTDADRALIAEVLARLDADVLAFQEIVTPAELQRVLDCAKTLLPARDYRIHDNNNNLLGAGAANDQKIVLAFDAQKYEWLTASSIHGGVKRLPFALRLRSKTSASQMLVVGVHFQSGWPRFDDADDAEIRRQQAQHLAAWVNGAHAGANPALPKPDASEHAIILGDFNALYEREPHQPASYQISVDSLAPLRSAPLANWRWEKPLADPAGGGPITSHTDRLLIDFIMLSPSLKERVKQAPTILAYDLTMTGAGGKDLPYSVSDHRPVYVEIDD